MKYLSEFRDPELVKNHLDEIKKTVTQSWTIMEVCGGQTHSLVKNGILNLLPEEIVGGSFREGEPAASAVKPYSFDSG